MNYWRLYAIESLYVWVRMDLYYTREFVMDIEKHLKTREPKPIANLTVRVPKDLKERADALLKENGVTWVAFVNACIHAYLEKHSK